MFTHMYTVGQGSGQRTSCTSILIVCVHVFLSCGPCKYMLIRIHRYGFIYDGKRSFRKAKGLSMELFLYEVVLCTFFIVFSLTQVMDRLARFSSPGKLQPSKSISPHPSPGSSPSPVRKSVVTTCSYHM